MADYEKFLHLAVQGSVGSLIHRTQLGKGVR